MHDIINSLRMYYYRITTSEIMSLNKVFTCNYEMIKK